MDASAHLPKGQVLYLAGSAINSLIGTDGKVDVMLGAQAMREALALWQAGEAPMDIEDPLGHVRALYGIAQEKGLKALTSAIEQRYAWRH
jgi:hypothetical protein